MQKQLRSQEECQSFFVITYYTCRDPHGRAATCGTRREKKMFDPVLDARAAQKKNHMWVAKGQDVIRPVLKARPPRKSHCMGVEEKNGSVSPDFSGVTPTKEPLHGGHGKEW